MEQQNFFITQMQFSPDAPRLVSLSVITGGAEISIKKIGLLIDEVLNALRDLYLNAVKILFPEYDPEADSFSVVLTDLQIKDNTKIKIKGIESSAFAVGGLLPLSAKFETEFFPLSVCENEEDPGGVLHSFVNALQAFDKIVRDNFGKKMFIVPEQAKFDF